MPTYLTVLREYAGAAATQKLSADILAADTSLTLDGFVNWPTGSVGPFYIVINRNNATEEKVSVGARSSAVLSSMTRAADATTAYNHSAGESVDVCYTAIDAREANYHSSHSFGVHGVGGNVIGDTDVQSLSNKTFILPGIADFSAAQHDHTTAAQGGAVAGIVTLTGTQTLSNKTLVTPTVASLVNMQHTHASAAQGGTLANTAGSPSYASSFSDFGAPYGPLSVSISPSNFVTVKFTATRTSLWSGPINIVTGCPVPSPANQQVVLGWNTTTNSIVRYNLTSGGNVSIVTGGAANDTVSFSYSYQS